MSYNQIGLVIVISVQFSRVKAWRRLQFILFVFRCSVQFYSFLLRWHGAELSHLSSLAATFNGRDLGEFEGNI